MDKDNQNIVILFADISESTLLYDRMGDITATKMIKKCHSLMEEIAQLQLGDVINAVGDKANCIFWDAASAVLAAKGMNEAIDDYIMNSTDGRIPINLHIGIHSGPVQKEGNKLFGDTINVVARVTQIAKPREILITEPVFNDLEDTLKQLAQITKRLKIKDKNSPLYLYEFNWEDYDTTVAIDRATFRELETVQNACLELTYQNQVYEITNQVPNLKLGRQTQNDLIIREKSASRFHAVIKLVNDKFVLIDQSTNGTFVYPQDDKPYCAKWTEAYLEGSGIICLGKDRGLDSPVAIHYRIKDAT